MTEADIYQVVFKATSDAFDKKMIEAMQTEITKVEAGRLLGRSTMTIHRWVKDGIITVGKNGKILRSEVLRILNQ